MRNHRNRSVMKHTFAEIPKADISRSKFDRSHGYKTTFDAGYLIPVLIDEVLPGDTFNVRMTGFARLATPIFPIMDNMFMDTQFFAVPIRLIWENFERQQGAQDNPGDSTDYLDPVLSATTFTAGSIFDYAGLPTDIPLGGASQSKISSLPFRAMNLIYNEWYRDQNQIDSLAVPLGDGPDDPALFTLQRRGKRADYITTCLPWPQKGQAVQIPLGSIAPVLPMTPDHTTTTYATSLRMRNTANGGFPAVTTGMLISASGNVHNDATNPIGTLGTSWYPANLYADLNSATAATINSLRQAFQIQKIFERDARGGTRYVEQLKAHWNVTSPDARLQRPEYLGGGSSPVNITPIPQTSASGAYADSPQGTLAAMGTTVLNNHGFTMSFTEHCYIIGFVSVRADLTYQQFIDRMWSRRTRFDRFMPALGHIGEQAVLQKEVMSLGTTADDDLVFGYQERFGEYRFKRSQITGLFRSNHPQSLDAWHLSQDFAVPPVLGQTFIEENPPLDRCIAVDTEPHFLFDAYVKMSCARPMPLYGEPGLIDHF